MSEKRRALIIGGTGTISLSVVKRLLSLDWEVWTINRGKRSDVLPPSVRQIHVDIKDEEAVKAAISSLHFDSVAEFVAYERDDVERDRRLFMGKTEQYIFVSSASAYEKPPRSPFITEETPLENPYWEYSRNKKECEEYLFSSFRNEGFPVTVVRPSHTYDDRKFPVAVHGAVGSWSVVKRMIEKKKILVPGDGSSLWTVTWCEDFAVGFAGIMGRKETLGEAYQITGSETLTWNQILSTIASSVGGEYRPCYVPSSLLASLGRRYGYDYEGELLGDKANSVIFLCDKIRTAVPEMKTTVSFSMGAKRCAKRILSDPELQKEDRDFDIFSDKVVEIMERMEKEL